MSFQALYSDSPIETSLFSLYIQQNYTQFCEDVDQCDGVADWLSWVDCSGGDAVSTTVAISSSCHNPSLTSLVINGRLSGIMRIPTSFTC